MKPRTYWRRAYPNGRAQEIEPRDQLAKRANAAMRKWLRTLSPRQRRQLAALR